jgi:GNAT superfamily N-acetyltransferase
VPDQSPAAEAVLQQAGFEAWMLDFVQRPIVAADAPPPAGVALRPAGPDDGTAVTSLLSEFGPPRTPPAERMEAVLRTYADHLRRMDAGQGRIMVAELEGAVVGVYGLEWRAPFQATETHAWLADLIVTEAARGRGIGRFLLADAIAAARAVGASQLSLESGRTREAAHDLYRSTGFAPAGQSYRMLRMDR